jgi:hypothetical protein
VGESGGKRPTQTRAAPSTARRRHGREREALPKPATLFTMGKKSREKRATQLERDRKRDEGGAGPSSSSPDASNSRVAGPPAHHDTPAAAAKPSTDDMQGDESASTTANASDSTAAVTDKLRVFCESCADRLADDFDTWVDGEFSRDIDAVKAAVKAAAERGDAKAQYATGFMMSCGVIPSDVGDSSGWLRKAATQDYPDSILAVGVRLVAVIVRGNCPQGQEEAFHSSAKTLLTRSAVEHHSAKPSTSWACSTAGSTDAPDPSRRC